MKVIAAITADFVMMVMLMLRQVTYKCKDGTLGSSPLKAEIPEGAPDISIRALLSSHDGLILSSL
ncbi:MAG: hypothetical protein ACLRQF_17455 [Thomasclavelia ramosa]